MRQWLFCYGTLMLPRLMAAVIGRRAVASPASLAGYGRAGLPGRPYPGLWRQAGSRTDGMLYTLRHRGELRRLDKYEGAEYRRCRVIASGPHGAVQAWVYLPHGRCLPGRARTWSLPLFAQRNQDRYLRQIAAWRGTGVADADADNA